MANKIDKINVGGADYEINLPTGATPTISSLTITGNLTVSGTANLSVVSFNSPNGGLINASYLILSTISNVEINAGKNFMLETSQGSQAFTSSTIRFTSPLSDVSRNIVFQPGINEGDEVVSKIRFAGGGVNNSINAFANRFAFDGAPITVSSIGTSLSTLCQLPNKSGTIALTSDIPNSLSCTPARRRINTTVSIKAGFNIYPGLNFGTSLSYGVLYCFGTAAELPIGSGTKYFSTQAIGFKIKQMVNLSTDEGIEGSFAIIALQDFNASYMYSYNLTLS